MQRPAPRIASSPPAHFDEDGVFRYQVVVDDPDDSSFRFQLLEGPDGMDVDLFDGKLSWAPQESQGGRHSVKVQVKDRKGATVTQTFAVEVDFVVEEVAADDVPAALASDRGY